MGARCDINALCVCMCAGLCALVPCVSVCTCVLAEDMVSLKKVSLCVVDLVLKRGVIRTRAGHMSSNKSDPRKTPHGHTLLFMVILGRRTFLHRPRDWFWLTLSAQLHERVVVCMCGWSIGPRACPVYIRKSRLTELLFHGNE